MAKSKTFRDKLGNTIRDLEKRVNRDKSAANLFVESQRKHINKARETVINLVEKHYRNNVESLKSSKESLERQTRSFVEREYLESTIDSLKFSTVVLRDRVIANSNITAKEFHQMSYQKHLWALSKGKLLVKITHCLNGHCWELRRCCRAEFQNLCQQCFQKMYCLH